MRPPGPSTHTSSTGTDSKRLEPGRIEDHAARRGPDDRRLGGRRPQVLHTAVGPRRRPRHRARRRLDAGQRARAELVSPQVAAGLEAVCDQERRAVRIPLGGDVTGQVEGEIGLLTRRHVPHHRLPAPAPLMPDEEPGVPVHRSEAQDFQSQLLRTALGVVELGDRRPVGPHHAQRRMHGVPVLRVLDGDEAAVVREVADAGRLAVPVDLLGRAAAADDMDRRAVLVRGAAHDRRRAVPPDGQARRVRGFEPVHRGDVFAPAEGLAQPDPELVPVLVAEPPDPLAVGGQEAVRRPVRPVRRSALLARRPVPRVQLVRPRRVRHEQRAVRRVLRPVGQGHPRRTEALLPVRHGSAARPARGPVALSHGPIVPPSADNPPVRFPSLWITSPPCTPSGRRGDEGDEGLTRHTGGSAGAGPRVVVPGAARCPSPVRYVSRAASIRPVRR